MTPNLQSIVRRCARASAFPRTNVTTLFRAGKTSAYIWRFVKVGYWPCGFLLAAAWKFSGFLLSGRSVVSSSEKLAVCLGIIRLPYSWEAKRLRLWESRWPSRNALFLDFLVCGAQEMKNRALFGLFAAVVDWAMRRNPSSRIAAFAHAPPWCANNALFPSFRAALAGDCRNRASYKLTGLAQSLILVYSMSSRFYERSAPTWLSW